MLPGTSATSAYTPRREDRNGHAAGRGPLRFLRLLVPGLHLKRWLGLTLIGLVVLALGLAYLFVELYRTLELPAQTTYLTLQFIPRWLRGLLFVAAGAAVTALAVVRLNRSLMEPLARSGTSVTNGVDIVDALVSYRQRERGPKIVAIGGGTGLSTMLRGLKHYSANVTAIVTVADDGGSSGRLRRELGVLPPGDFRNCIVALADAEPLMARLFQYRFGQGSGLDGHSFGNLFIVAMSGITGNFEEAIREASRVLAVRGQILPSTLENVTLCAELEDEAHVRGESKISQTTARIRRVYLQPDRPAAFPEAVRAILDADMVIVGPGSLYTSILPNLLVDGIAKAVASTEALRVYVCNVATQPGETDDFRASDHLHALLKHQRENPIDVVLANHNLEGAIKPEWNVKHVVADVDDLSRLGVKVALHDVVDPNNALRHSPDKLAAALMQLYDGHRAASPGASRSLSAAS
ncbi:MAG: YvcK family protein [Chloroflexi bacterium]|nr:YvcK family protein [Chloroflexota bacterium]